MFISIDIHTYIQLITDTQSRFFKNLKKKPTNGGLPCGPGVRTLPSKAGDMGSIPAWELDPTCCRATKPVHDNYREAHTPQQKISMKDPRSHN